MGSIRRSVAARHALIVGGEAAGFTLIEMLVVVIIIGVLAAIAIPVFLVQREAAWKASVESDLKNTALFVELWAVDHKGSVDGADVGVVPVSSNSNIVKISVASQAYTICGSNPDLGLSITYDSAAGGLKSATFAAGAC